MGGEQTDGKNRQRKKEPPLRRLSVASSPVYAGPPISVMSIVHLPALDFMRAHSRTMDGPSTNGTWCVDSSKPAGQRQQVVASPSSPEC